MDRVMIAAACWALLGSAHAATLYRWVSPQGVVTYQNSPPPQSAARVKVMHLGGREPIAAMRHAVSALHPVVLYRAPHCVPCRQASRYLRQRKVPFKEVDIAAGQAILRSMKAATGTTTVPTITVGKHVLVGYIPSALGDELAAAGYLKIPKS